MMEAEARNTGLQADSFEPLWQQAARVIEHDIACGKLAAGGRLPSERQLLEQLSISRVTLRRALQSLGQSGVLVSSHGRGWYVAEAARQEFPKTLESFTETAARLGLVSSSQVIRAEEAPATLDEAEELSIAPGSPLFHLSRIRLLDDVPVAVDISYFPLQKGQQIHDLDFSNASLFTLLSEAGVEVARAEATVEARIADPQLAQQLKIGVGHPVLAMRQLVEDTSGRPILASTILYAGERYRLRTSFSRLTKGG